MKTGASLFVYIAFLVAILVYPADAGLNSSISRILSRPSERNVQYGIHIIEAGSGKKLYARNASEPMIPASNMKLITTAAALHYLGPDYVYKTVVALRGNTLVIIGGGDPLLGDRITDIKHGREKKWIFQDIAQLVVHNDVNNIQDIIVDTTVFDDERVHPNWPTAELNRWYACEVSGLNYNGNCVDITCSNVAGRINVEIDPRTSFLKIINQIRPVSSGSGAVGAYRTETLNTVMLRGRCHTTQGPFRVAIERPAAFFAFLLAEQLANYNITAHGRVIEKGPVNRSELTVLKTYHTSLTDCLDRANKDSLGLVAEALLKTIAANANANSNGSWPAGRKLVGGYLTGLRIRPDRFYIDDASGLSRSNKLSPDCITAVLRATYKSSNSKMYMQSLAVGGVDGTIGRYFGEPQYKGKIIGKTGYIDGVKSFSGYCGTADRDYIFSIIANGANGTTREAINDIVKAIIDDNSPQ
jgi:D-alanyl-D-alanine carboxypeptidase/D-alanyl-D-alanine-endopeptidase (penicillin-binding protein 4)